MKKIVNYLENILLVVCVGQKMETRCGKGPPYLTAGRRGSVLPCLWLIFLFIVLRGLGIVFSCAQEQFCQFIVKHAYVLKVLFFSFSESSLSWNALLHKQGSMISV